MKRAAALTMIFTLFAFCACSTVHTHEDSDGDGMCDTCNEKMTKGEQSPAITFADLRDLNTVRFGLTKAFPALDISDVKVTENGQTVAISRMEKVSNLQANLIFSAPLSLTGRYELSVAGSPAVPIIPTTYFGSEEFEQNYAYDGDLGVKLTNTQTFLHIWAPTATAVTCNLYNRGSGGTPLKSIPMTRGERGVWEHIENENLSGLYYTYTVETALGAEEAVDPYAVSAGLNGERGMILDLKTTDPQGWTEDVSPFADREDFNYTDAEIWEIHVRDFSAELRGSEYKGKYLAFTETGLKNSAGMPVGVDYLKELGVTHVHLLPAFDFASVDEADDSQRNWGYDPQNYNVPEGSYSTDPTRGEVRVNEFKRMVQSLHQSGIGVIMDVVYNHTFDLNSNFNKIVPHYYYRYLSNGKPSEGSGCGNETASERAMFRRFMRDSVLYWLKEYHLDGFRFDLMGLHDVETMQEIERAVHEVNPNAILYGEGWTGGSTTLSATKQAVLANIRAVNENTQTNGIAMFNDALRDALKGSADGRDTGFATGAIGDLAGGVLFGANGGVENAEIGARNSKGVWSAYNGTNIVNYASAHDNLTLWDKICSAYGEEESTLELRLKRDLLCAAIVQTSLGIPFLQAGEEMLRTKKNADGSYNPNSYNASDDVNVLKWELLTDGSPQTRAKEYYRGLFAFRKAHQILRSPQTEIRSAKIDGATITLTMHLDGESDLFIVYNAEEREKTVSLPAGKWQLFIDGERAGTDVLSAATGDVTVGAVSCSVYEALLI